MLHSRSISSLLLAKHGAQNSCSHSNDSSNNSDSNHSLLGQLVLDDLTQLGALRIIGLDLKQQVAVLSSICVFAELVGADGEVVETLSTSRRSVLVNLGENLDSQLLVLDLSRFDQTPSIVEASLDGDEIALVVVLLRENI